MPEAVVIEFSGIGAAEYHAVNSHLGLDLTTGEGDWPDGLVSHTGAANDDGLLVFEIWETQDHQHAFMESRLGPAIGAAGVPAPSRVEWFTVAGTMSR